MTLKMLQDEQPGDRCSLCGFEIDEILNQNGLGADGEEATADLVDDGETAVHCAVVEDTIPLAFPAETHFSSIHPVCRRCKERGDCRKLAEHLQAP